MNMEIENIQPKLVFDYFKQISKIPRESGNEKAISDYLTAEAKRLNLEVIQDDTLNVIIKKPATKGYENSTGVIIQGHMDMVCEKNKTTEHDFSKDPINLKVKDGYLYADNTTLGADNGIAIAMALAILASDDLCHPAIETLFTVNEEVSMIGAIELDGDLLDGKYIINIDSEEESKITVSCAGGVTAIVKADKEYESLSSSKKIYAIDIKGLQGGHSGLEIDKNRANANILLGRVLNKLSNLKDLEYDLLDINGGLKNNAIPRESECIIAIDEKYYETLQKGINDILADFKNEYKTSDKDVDVKLKEVDAKYDKKLSESVKNKVIAVLNLMPRGIQTMSSDIEGLVQSSTNLGVIKSKEDIIEFEFATRSSVKSLKTDINNNMELLSKIIGVKLELEDDYPQWEYKKDSELEKICVETYEKLTGNKPEIVALHAGLECGVLIDKIKDAQAVSIGPNIYDVHTPNEHLDIESTQRTWTYLVEILKNIK